MQQLRGRYDSLVSYRLQERREQRGLVTVQLPKGFCPLGLSIDLGGRIQLDALVDARAAVEETQFVLQNAGILRDDLREALRPDTGQWCKSLGRIELPQIVYVFLLFPAECRAFQVSA
jgi:hypothetical protein